MPLLFLKSGETFEKSRMEVLGIENDLYLNQVRNAFILLVVSFAIFASNNNWRIISVIMIVLGIFFLTNIVVYYYLRGIRTTVMDLTTLGVIATIGVLIWSAYRVYFETSS